jgi:hypothetical protein
MKVIFSGFTDVFISFFNAAAGFSGGTLISRNNRIPIFAFVKRRRVYTVLLIFLLTFCYQIPASSMIYHKEGVLHNNIFENHTAFKHTKNDGIIPFCLPAWSSWDPLSIKLRAYSVIYILQNRENQIKYCYLIVHKCRDDLLRPSIST